MRKKSFWRLCLPAACLMAAALRADVLPELHPHAVRAAADGTFTIDSASLPGGWSRLYADLPGKLEPGKRYTATAQIDLKELGDDSRLLFLIRPAAAPDHTADIVSREYSRPGEYRFKAEFTVPGNIRDYTFQIHVRNKVKAVLSDVRVAAGNPDDVRIDAAAGNTGDFVLPPLPTGSPEFKINLPVPSGKVIDAATFGVSESNDDNTAQLNAAIRAAAEQEADLRLSPGKYFFRSDRPVSFSGLKNFQFDGGGSILVFHKKHNSLLTIDRCRTVAFRNFSIDWDWDAAPLASYVRLVNAHPEGAYIDFEFIDYKEFPVKKIRVADIDSVDPETMSVGVEGGVNRYYEFSPGQKSPESEWLGPNLLRFHVRTPELAADWLDRAARRELFRMRHYVYDMIGVDMHDNTHLTLENVNVYSAPAHAFGVGGHQSYWQFLNTNVIRPPYAPRRLITCSADHLHISQSNGYFKMIGCDFSFGGDDCLNVHDCSGFALRRDDHTLKPCMQDWYFQLFKAGDRIELRNDDFSPTGYIAELRSNNGTEFIFDRPLPQPTGQGFVMFNHSYDSSNVIIRNNKFHNNRARALLLLGRNITVENNEFFHQQQAAVEISTGFTTDAWSEGYGVDNVVVRNNTFSGQNGLEASTGGRVRDFWIGGYNRWDPLDSTYPILTNILIEGNRFENPTGLALYAANARNVIFRGNTILAPRTKQRNLPYRGSIYAWNASNVFILDNVFIRSSGAKTYFIEYDSSNSSGIFVRRNRVITPN